MFPFDNIYTLTSMPCLKRVNISKWRAFFCHAVLIFLAIQQQLLRQITLPDKKTPRCWIYFQFSK